MADKRDGCKRNALVKWVGGQDNGQLHIIDVSWIKNFKEAEWKKKLKEERETEVAEWKKTPGGTYVSYDCEVLLVSDRLQHLKAEKTRIEEIIKKEETDKAAKTAMDGQINTEEDQEKSGSVADSSEEEDETSRKKDDREIKRKADSKVLQKLEKQTNKLNDEEGQNKTSTSKKVSSDMVPIHPKSPYLVDSVVYNHSRLQGYSNFASAMATQLFKSSILVVSNITGGANKIDHKGLHRWALDKNKIRAIRATTVDLFPSTKPTQVNAAINRFINNLRSRLKKRGKLDKFVAKGCKIMEGQKHTASSDESDCE